MGVLRTLDLATLDIPVDRHQDYGRSGIWDHASDGDGLAQCLVMDEMLHGHQGYSHYSLSLSRLFALDSCAEMLAAVRRGPGSPPTDCELVEYLIQRKRHDQERPPVEHYSFEHVCWRRKPYTPATTRLLTRRHAASCFLHPGSLLPAPHSCREATLFQTGNSHSAWQDRAYNFVSACVPLWRSRCIVSVFLAQDD